MFYVIHVITETNDDTDANGQCSTTMDSSHNLHEVNDLDKSRVNFYDLMNSYTNTISSNLIAIPVAVAARSIHKHSDGLNDI